ncbi:MarR family winged helix-turn-helix transcriptional regulator [Humibacter sp. RRB41]|uniref:MarR family winged helix-turn-helix transcriptional regulator n=1 Tax=Humibacter sp. RRB41 TaxID=2919946 RepID=UPI001FAAD79F|nr:MarR family transcriptional regulator [Humibacter sp. RRB41]
MTQPTVPAASLDVDAVALGEQIRAVVGRLSRRLREESTVGDYTQSQKNVIVRLDREGAATLSALARAEGMKPQSMATILAALDEASVVRSERDPDDKRQVLWSLTPQAMADLTSSRAARTDWVVRSIREHLDADEGKQLAQAMQLLERLLDETP